MLLLLFVMKNIILFLVLFCFIYFLYSQYVQVFVNVYQWQSILLNGYWKYIVDFYENGFYNYCYEFFENQENFGVGVFFINIKFKSKVDLIEYDFDKMDSLLVLLDWNI